MSKIKYIIPLLAIPMLTGCGNSNSPYNKELLKEVVSSNCNEYQYFGHLSKEKAVSFTVDTSKIAYDNRMYGFVVANDNDGNKLIYSVVKSQAIATIDPSYTSVGYSTQLVNGIRFTKFLATKSGHVRTILFDCFGNLIIDKNGESTVSAYPDIKGATDFVDGKRTKIFNIKYHNPETNLYETKEFFYKENAEIVEFTGSKQSSALLNLADYGYKGYIRPLSDNNDIVLYNETMDIKKVVSVDCLANGYLTSGGLVGRTYFVQELVELNDQKTKDYDIEIAGTKYDLRTHAIDAIDGDQELVELPYFVNSYSMPLKNKDGKYKYAAIIGSELPNIDVINETLLIDENLVVSQMPKDLTLEGYKVGSSFYDKRYHKLYNSNYDVITEFKDEYSFEGIVGDKIIASWINDNNVVSCGILDSTGKVIQNFTNIVDTAAVSNDKAVVFGSKVLVYDANTNTMNEFDNAVQISDYAFTVEETSGTNARSIYAYGEQLFVQENFHLATCSKIDNAQFKDIFASIISIRVESTDSKATFITVPFERVRA